MGRIRRPEDPHDVAGEGAVRGRPAVAGRSRGGGVEDLEAGLSAGRARDGAAEGQGQEEAGATPSRHGSLDYTRRVAVRTAKGRGGIRRGLCRSMLALTA